MAITLVAGNAMSAETDGSATTITSPAFTNNISTNNLIVIGVSWVSDGTLDDATVTDSAGNSYSRTETGPTYDAGNGEAITCYYTVVSAGGGTKPTVTASFWTTTAHSVAKSVPYRVINCAEFTGNATASVLDKHGTRVQAPSGSGTDMAQTPSATVTPSTDGQLIWGFGAQDNGGTGWNANLTSGTGYTELSRAVTVSPAGYPYQSEYKVQTTATAVQALWTLAIWSSTDSWLSVMATFKAAAADVLHPMAIL